MYVCIQSYHNPLEDIAMKKLFAFLLAMTMLFAFAACTAPAA